MVDLIAGAAGVRKRRSLRSAAFTPRKRARFLEALALTCNIAKAAAFADIHPSAVYEVRMRDAVFAEQWDEALATACARLEVLVLEHGGAGQALEPGTKGAGAMEADPAPFDFDRALKALAQFRAGRVGVKHATQRSPRNATREETNAALAKAVTAAWRRVEAGQRQLGVAEHRADAVVRT